MPTAEQLTFQLPRHSARGLEDFMASPANEAALAQVMDWPNWPQGKALLSGPHGSGKTHLACVWAELSEAEFWGPSEIATARIDNLPKAIVLDDCDRLIGAPEPERQLFHLFNATREARVPLLVVAAQPPARWTIGLPDLASRMAQLPLAKLTQPDDILLSAVTAKQFLDRQLNVKPEVVTYIVRRIDRSFDAVSAFVERLDSAALKGGRTITIPFVRDVLGAQ